MMDTVAVAKRFVKNNQANVNVVEREYDWQWEVIEYMDDPTLSEYTAEFKERGLTIPKRWVTIAVVKPYIIDGIMKSLEKDEGKLNG